MSRHNKSLNERSNRVNQSGLGYEGIAQVNRDVVREDPSSTSAPPQTTARHNVGDEVPRDRLARTGMEPSTYESGRAVHTLMRPAQQPASRTTLSPLGRRFTEIRVGMYSDCRTFIINAPNILNEEPKTFVADAVAALRAGGDVMHAHARRCVQQALLLQKCKTDSRSRNEFLRLLVGGDRDTVEEFLDNFDTSLETCEKVANASIAASSNHEPVHQSTYNRTRPDEGGESSGLATRLNDLSLPRTGDRHGDGRDSTQPGYSNSQGASNHPRHERGDSGYASTQATLGIQQPMQLAGTSPGTDILATAGNSEVAEGLNGRYAKRKGAERFFRVGRVFALLWHESANAGARNAYQGRFNEWIYSSIRRMAVVQEGHGTCWAIPISTYGDQGVAKPGFDQRDIDGHAIIYMDGSSPRKRNNEPEMRKHPIKVTGDKNQELEPMSRINFTKVHTVEHNVKVMNVGFVADSSMPFFTSYWSDHSTPRPSGRA